MVLKYYKITMVYPFQKRWWYYGKKCHVQNTTVLLLHHYSVWNYQNAKPQKGTTMVLYQKLWYNVENNHSKHRGQI